jgi:hypothetical protein
MVLLRISSSCPVNLPSSGIGVETSWLLLFLWNRQVHLGMDIPPPTRLVDAISAESIIGFVSLISSAFRRLDVPAHFEGRKGIGLSGMPMAMHPDGHLPP